MSDDLVHVQGLTVRLPGGAPIVTAAELRLSPGEIVALLGPSGAGKSTLLRAVFAPDELRRQGFFVEVERADIHAAPAFVPQRGALLDHLDVTDNVDLALAAATPADVGRDAAAWLSAVDLDASVGHRGRPVASLSGGQAQRVAVARTLAAGRRVIVLDEPSVGLDPLGVHQLAALLGAQARGHGVAMLVITHDLTLAAAADRVLFLDAAAQRLVPLLDDESDAQRDGEAPATRRAARQRRLETEVLALLAEHRPAAAGHGRARRRTEALGALRVAGEGLLRLLDPRLLRPSTVVLRRALAQALLRPLVFYLVVALLLGVTVPYVVVHLSVGLRPAALLGLVGGSYILSLSPPISAIVFAATSGSAVNAWLGGMRLGGQVVALEGIGVSPSRYLWSPAWIALVVSYLVVAAAFTASMTFGGWLLFDHYAVPEALARVTADFLDPAPEREPYLWRALWLSGAYALGIASFVVARGREPKDRSDHVTSGMTSAVMRSTLLVVVLELLSIAVLFTLEPRG